MPKFEIIRDETEGYWWRLSDGNGESIAYSAKTYTSRNDCERDISIIRSLSVGAGVEERTREETL